MLEMQHRRSKQKIVDSVVILSRAEFTAVDIANIICNLQGCLVSLACASSHLFFAIHESVGWGMSLSFCV